MECPSEKISMEEAAAFLECSTDQVERELRAGRLPGIKIGKPWIIPRLAFNAAVNDLAIDAARELREKLKESQLTPAQVEVLLPKKRKGRPRRYRTED